MEIYVREKEFVDKKKNEKVKYNEFYVKFHIEIDKVEEVELPLKIDDRFAKTLLIQNLNTSSFDIITIQTEKGTYYNPVVMFNVGGNQYRVPVKLSASEVTLLRLAIKQNITLGF